MTENTRVFNVFPVFFREKAGDFLRGEIRGTEGEGWRTGIGGNGGEGTRKRREAFYGGNGDSEGRRDGKRRIQGREQQRDNARASARSNRKAPHRSEGFS